MSRLEVRKQLTTVIRASAERDRIRAANQKTKTAAFQRSSSHHQTVRRYRGDHAARNGRLKGQFKEQTGQHGDAVGWLTQKVSLGEPQCNWPH